MSIAGFQRVFITIFAAISSSNCAGKVEWKKLFTAAARDMTSAALPKAAVQINGEYTDDDYFAWIRRLCLTPKRHQIQQTTVTMEVLQFLDDDKKGSEMLNRLATLQL